MGSVVTFQSVMKAYNKLLGAVRVTPLLQSKILTEEVGIDTWLKLENLQLTGSFKVRGAMNKIFSLTDDEVARGVVTASAGNHAQGVAYAAALRGISAKIVVPTTTPETKRNGIINLGAELVVYGASYTEAQEHALKLATETGRVFVHAFADDAVIAGQGTAALEVLLEQADFDAIIVPAGGGGLICGTALVAKAINPDIKVYGVQSPASSHWVESFKVGELVKVSYKETLAEGLAGCVTPENLELALKLVDDFRLVEEAAIANAMLWFAEKHQYMVEGSGAIGVAALQSGVFPELVGKKVLVLITGGNVDFSRLVKLSKEKE